jgi:hypothetical protein
VAVRRAGAHISGRMKRGGGKRDLIDDGVKTNNATLRKEAEMHVAECAIAVSGPAQVFGASGGRGGDTLESRLAITVTKAALL